MFDSDEADGYNQLEQNITPSSENQAASTLDGFKQLGDQAFHSLLGESPFPEWKDVFNVMFSSTSETTGAVAAHEGLPKLDLVQPNMTGAIANQGLPNLEIVNYAGESAMQSVAATQLAVPTDISSIAQPLMDKLSMPGGPGMEALKTLDAPFKTEALGQVMTEMFKTLLQGPLGIFAAVLQFLVGMFAEFLTAAGEFLSEAAQSAATFAAEAWKKELELASRFNPGPGT